MASAGDVTVIGRTATFRGELTGEGDVQIEGVLEGSVHAAGARITVGAEAKVRALLSAQDIVVYGRVEGELRATGRAELRSTAMVLGDVFSARLAVEEEAVLRGHVDSFQAAEAGAGTEAAGSRGPQAWARSTVSQDSGALAAGKANESVTLFPRNPASATSGMPSGLAAAAASVATARPASGGQGDNASELKNS